MKRTKCAIFSLILTCLANVSLSNNAIAHTEKSDAHSNTQGSKEQPQQGDVTITPLIDNVFLHRSYFNVSGFGLVEANGLVVIEDNKAYIIDTPWTDNDTAKLLEWISEQGAVPVSAIVTHSHQDRSGGIAHLKLEHVNTIALDKTQQFLIDQDKPLAETIFRENEFPVLLNKIEAHFLGEGHTADNIVVWLPESKVLFAGCLVKSLASSSVGYIAEANLEDWPATLYQLKAKFSDAKLVVPGHGDAGDISLIDHTISIIEHYNATHP